MERLTTNKAVAEMGLIELAHNSCYIDNNRNVRYRDYELDIDSRQLVRNLIKDMCCNDLSDFTDTEFDEYMAEEMLEIDSQIGLLALFYRNLCAMADLREKLKEFEDLEECIGVPIKTLAKLFNNHVPEDCKNPKKAIVLTDDDVDKWHDYKNAEEQGLLLRLPCKVGDTVYYIENNVIYEFIVYLFDIRPLQKFVCNYEGIRLNLKNFGKTVFPTKAEAEQKLKEMKGE